MPIEWPWFGADLQDVSAASASDAWAVGNVHTPQPQPYVTHLVNGTFRRLPIRLDHGGGLQAVTLVDGHPFTVGFRYDARGHTHPLAIQRVQGTWVRNGLGRRPGGMTFNDVAVTPEGVWVVGQRETWSGSTPVIFRWTGDTWMRLSPPDPVGGVLYGIEASAEGDLWAVGGNYVIHRPAGGPWQVVDVPLPSGGEFDFLFDAATYQDHVWLAGYYYDGSVIGTVAYQWDGSTWNVFVDADPTVGSTRQYRDVAIGRTGVVLASGVDVQSPSWKAIVHTWTDTDPLVWREGLDGRGDVVLEGVSAIPGSDTGFFLVATDNSAQGQPRIYRNCTY